ncbi:MAG: hypothetical protein WD942_03720 [Dehalococcoidia bacterium]
MTAHQTIGPAEAANDSSIIWSEVESLVLEAVEDAAIQGLCSEGQIELAAGRLRSLMPHASEVELFEAVRQMIRLRRR